MRASAKARARRQAHARAMSDLRPQVLARDGWRCQAAGVLDGPCSGALAVHHRYIATRVDTLENLTVLCHEHHQGDTGVHANPARAYDLGLLVHAADGPPTEPWTPPTA